MVFFSGSLERVDIAFKKIARKIIIVDSYIIIYLGKVIQQLDFLCKMANVDVHVRNT
ncbi:hypothetical protein LCGC14_2449100, partial [marine sediment metagenome]